MAGPGGGPSGSVGVVVRVAWPGVGGVPSAQGGWPQAPGAVLAADVGGRGRRGRGVAHQVGEG